MREGRNANAPRERGEAVDMDSAGGACSSDSSTCPPAIQVTIPRRAFLMRRLGLQVCNVGLLLVRLAAKDASRGEHR